MKPAILRGVQHRDLGAVAAIAEADCAIAISRGGAGKPYRHKDPNEDAAAFLCGRGGSFVVVADGHSGCEAAQRAVERLVEHHAPTWIQPAAETSVADWPEAFLAAIVDVQQAIVRHAAEVAAMSSRTTLAFALVRPAENLLVFASAGDSHVFRVTADGADDLSEAAGSRKIWLGAPAESPESLRERCAAGARELAGTRAVVLATDGISEPGIGLAEPALAVRDAVARGCAAEPELRALVAGKLLVESALAAHCEQRAGDNVAAAVAWVAD